MGKSIVFVTTNKGKVASCQKYFKKTDTKVEIYTHELIEPRTDDIKEIAKSKVLQAYDMVKKPCIALDTGFFIEAINGFPRAFVNFALDTIGIEGILKLMEGQKNRYCYFKECLAYYDGEKVEYFEAVIPGTLSEEIRGIDKEIKWSDLWYIFKPERFEVTLAEMTDEQMELREKTKPKSAFELFSSWYEEQI